jgi:PHD/YefM family antitoxin component YafN of YafNO toxin-antitoxin module
MSKPESTVPVSQVQRSCGKVADLALREPIVITAKGRPSHVLMAFDEYQRLKARDRRAYRSKDLPDDLAAALELGLADLWNPSTRAEVGDNLIG